MRVRAVDKPDRDALTAFCRHEHPRLVGMLTLYCGNGAVAEELAQETLARVWHKWPRVRRLDRPDAWARRVALNLANSHFRRVLAERRAVARLPNVPEPTDADSGLIDIVTRLPRRQRAVVVLHYYLDLSLEEVAAHLDTTVPSVKSLLHRALKRLRSETEADLLEAPDAT